MITLVIGYGNPLRGDDSAGWHAAELIAADPRARRVTVLGCHQLTPEMAEDVNEADLVLLVDASVDGSPPGSVTTTAVGEVNRSTGRGGLAWSHDLDAEGLVGLAERLYGRAPPALLLRVSAANIDPGLCLSPEVCAALPEVVEAVFGVIENRTRSQGSGRA